MRDLKICAIQSQLHWEDPVANRSMFQEKFKELSGDVDLIVLPEMFSTGFTMNSSSVAETMTGDTVAWMKEQAKSLDAALYGSAVIEDAGKYYNRGLFAKPSGDVITYDKRHLFRFANETDHYSPGNDRVVVEWRGWNILLQICYDLRFPVFSRNRGDHDLALYVANWPEVRNAPWSKLLLARAIENQCYVVGLNRVGDDEKGISHSGDSVIIDPKGDLMVAADPGMDVVIEATLDHAELERFREKFPVGKDADDFDLKL